MALSLRSPSFASQGAIPAQHTCEGDDVAPALTWSDAPAATRSFALIVDDPDAPDPKAPKTTWVHWVVFNLPAAMQALHPLIWLTRIWTSSSVSGGAPPA